MNAHAKGLRNQRKSKQYILSHPEIYGNLTSNRIHTVQSSSFGGDMFSVCYGYTDKKNIKTGEYEKVPLLAGWDIITMPMDLDSECVIDEVGGDIKLTINSCIYLIQVKTNNLPDNKYTIALKNFKVPFYVKKQLHIWEDRKKEPIIIDL